TDDPAVARAAREQVVAFCRSELLPHAAAEEAAMYPAAAATERARLLVDAMITEHAVIRGLADDVAALEEPVRAAAAAYALRVLFETHLAKENDLVLPVLAADPSVSVAALLAGMHELLGPDEHHELLGPDEHPESTTPVLDVRDVPHAHRRETVFGAVDAMRPGGSLLLVAPHDPVPLLDLLAARRPCVLAVGYEQRGPESWVLRLTRTA
ncbi:MAG: DUF2249 domain-containing protein, partial [Pseudonocardia sp.]